MDATSLYRACDARVGTSYPSGTCNVPAPAPIAECGFFPAVSGSFHVPGVSGNVRRSLMFVGQDWGSDVAFAELKRATKPHTDRDTGTGKALDQLLTATKIPREACFFTNALFGLRRGKTSVGRSPGWNATSYVALCKDALQIQIRAVQPKAIVCLGRDAPELLAQIVATRLPWNEARTFRDIDVAGQALITGARIEGRAVELAILVHPSHRRINAKYRSFNGKTGHPAEVELLRELSRRIGLT